MVNITNWFKSWKLLSWRTAIAAAIVIYGLAGFFVVPVIAKRLIVDIARERTGREVTVGEVDCNPFTLSLTIRDFSMPDRPGLTLVSFEELHANAQVSSLFRWAATLKELRVKNPHLGIRRFADGGINVVELMDDIKQRIPPSDEPREEGGLPRTLLQHILVTGTSLDVEDHAREESLLRTFGPSTFELHDISTIPNYKGENDFAIGLYRGGAIRVDGDVVVEPLGLEGTVEFESIHLNHAWPALQPFFEFAVVDGIVGGAFKYSVFVADDGLHARIHELNVDTDSIEVTAGSSDATVLKIASANITDAAVSWPEAIVRGAAVVVEGAEAFQWIRPDGTPSWDKLVPKETREHVVKRYRQIEEAFPWDIALERFEINGATARVEDRSFPETEELFVTDANIEFSDIKSGPGHRWGISASAMLLGEAEATARGQVTTGPMGLELEVGLDELDLGRFQPYIERLAPLELRAGKVETRGIAKISGGGAEPAASFTGDLTINEIDLRETAVGSTVLKWGRVDAKGINAGAGPLSLEVASLDIHGAGIEVVVSEEGKVNLIELLAVMAKNSGDESENQASGGEFEALPIKVDVVTLHACSAAYTDRTMAPSFTMAVDPVDGTLTGVSTESIAGAAIDIEGPVRSGGMVDVEGHMDLFDPKRLTDLAIDVRQAEMPPASSMAVRYIGHPMEEGKVDIDLDYEITSSELVGTNRFVTDGLELGDKVEGEGMVNLPIKLGVSLLTDKNGLITLEFPIEGNLDDPGFGLGNAIGSAAKEIMSELVKSPLGLLGKLGGGSGDEDFAFVEFEAGSSELESNAGDKLGTLAAGAGQRPELVLLVEGTVDPEADARALKEASLEAVTAEQQGGVAGPASLELLESLYSDAASREALSELRVQYEAGGGTAIDETAYYRDLHAAVIEAQPVDPAAVQALAGARAEAIRAFLVDELGVAAGRVRIIDPVTLEESQDDKWVRCRLDVDTGG